MKGYRITVPDGRSIIVSLRALEGLFELSASMRVGPGRLWILINDATGPQSRALIDAA